MPGLTFAAAALPKALHRLPRAPLGTILGVGLGLLVLLASGSILAVGYISARGNTLSLLQDKAELILSSIEQRIHDYVDPAAEQVRYLQGVIQAGEVDIDDPAALAGAFRAALAATPQVTGLAYITTDFRVIRVERGNREMRIEDWSDRPEVSANVAATLDGNGAGWRAPVWSAPFRQTLVPITLPIRQNGEARGILVSAILTTDLSRFLARFASPEQVPFILYGMDNVLAHPALSIGDPQSSLERPLRKIDEVGDTALAAIWHERRLPLLVLNGSRDEGHSIDFDHGESVYVYRRLLQYGDTPWLIGAHMPSTSLGQEVERLRWSALAGLVMMLIAVAAAIWIGRRIARPVMELAGAAERVERLDLAAVPELKRSRLRELDAAVRAFNSMVAALRWFELYVPKSIAHRLLGESGQHLAKAVERDVTVMFTDIVGFTRLAERMTPTEAAAFLNEHFALVEACVEAEQGTVDKFIGDSVMAFWGAPDRQPDHATRACRAAIAIARSLASANAERAGNHLVPVRIRIGISTGPVVVGNIGSAGRVNYTIVGDAVNLAQRIEQLGKIVAEEDSQATILLTDKTRERADAEITTVALGTRTVDGRDAPTGVYMLPWSPPLGSKQMSACEKPSS